MSSQIVHVGADLEVFIPNGERLELENNAAGHGRLIRQLKRCGSMGWLPPHLYHHDREALVDIDPELDRAVAPIKLRACSLQ